jgi:hypothetical protein
VSWRSKLPNLGTASWQWVAAMLSSLRRSLQHCPLTQQPLNATSYTLKAHPASLSCHVPPHSLLMYLITHCQRCNMFSYFLHYN